jgi:hypothetical protein
MISIIKNKVALVKKNTSKSCHLKMMLNVNTVVLNMER